MKVKQRLDDTTGSCLVVHIAAREYRYGTESKAITMQVSKFETDAVLSIQVKQPAGGSKPDIDTLMLRYVRLNRSLLCNRERYNSMLHTMREYEKMSSRSRGKEDLFLGRESAFQRARCEPCPKAEVLHRSQSRY